MASQTWRGRRLGVLRQRNLRRFHNNQAEVLEVRCLPASVTGTATDVTLTLSSGEDVTVSVDVGELVYDLGDGNGPQPLGTAADIASLRINGGSGNNQITLDLQAADVGLTGAVIITGSSGSDTVDASASDVRVSFDGGSGNDLLVGSVEAGNTPSDTLLGGSGDDTILGLEGDDVLSGGSGRDVLLGGAGNDSCLGGDGADKVSGGAGQDTVNGQAGRDSLTGDDGDDYVYGGAGQDLLSGGLGVDIVKGQGGRDIIQGSRAAAVTEAEEFIGLYIDLEALPTTPTLEEFRNFLFESRTSDSSSEFNSSFVFDTSFESDAEG